MKIKIKDPFKIDFKTISDDDVIALRTEIEKELKRRKIKFTVGEIGETKAISFFNNTPGLDNLQRAPVGTKNVDALSRKGDRYSIKTIKDGGKSGTVYPDPEIKNKELFEYILLVLLDEDFQLKSLYRFSWKQFLKIRQWDKTMNAWYIPKTQKALKNGESIYEK
ncbi:MAG: hypothetical protein ACTHOB_18535 [Ginsengibacter sp.]